MRLFVDMDGTLARFHDRILDEEGAVQIEKMYEKGYFENLEPFQNMVDMVNCIVEKYEDKVEVFVLSAVDHNEMYGIVEQKNAWIDKYLPHIDKEHRMYPEIGMSKVAVIPGGVKATDILIDDYNKNLREWEEVGGKAVKCINNVNHQGIGRFGGDKGLLWDGDVVSYDEEPDVLATMMRTMVECYGNEKYLAAVEYYQQLYTAPIDNLYVRTYARELIYCYDNHVNLLDFDCWTHLEDLIGSRMSFEEYTTLDSYYDGEMLEIDEDDGVILEALKENLERYRDDQELEIIVMYRAVEELDQRIEESEMKKGKSGQNPKTQSYKNKDVEL